MRKSKFTESQIAFILRQADEGAPITEVCRKAGISEAIFYNWRDCTRLGTPSLQGAGATYGENEPASGEDCPVLNLWTLAVNDGGAR